QQGFPLSLAPARVQLIPLGTLSRGVTAGAVILPRERQHTSSPRNAGPVGKVCSAFGSALSTPGFWITVPTCCPPKQGGADTPSPPRRALLGQHYTETHYSANGTEITEKPDTQVGDHCFYQGRVRGHPDSAASISTCSGLRAELGDLLALGGPPGPDTSHGRVGCLAWQAATLFALPFQRSGPIQKGPRYVELVLVADNQEVKWGQLVPVGLLSLPASEELKLYQPLRLRVALIGLEVWNHRDKITVSPNPEVTLDNFLHWRESELLRKKPHDNAQLITGVDFHGNTVGLAKKLVMCTRDSGGVNQDHSTNPIGAASTMAHEMGHNLGMSHDEDVAGCRCPIPKADGGCEPGGHPWLVYPKLFSRCSEQDMWQFLGDPRTSCLLNAPRADELYGGPVCGNQFVERGEQCDCGTPEECSDRCCNATTCQLREGAECARGECCQDCKVKAAGALCRASKNDCDLAEHCSGLSAECPEDVFQENGISCQHGNGYCYNGACPSHGEQCRALWGAGRAPSLPILLLRDAPWPGCGPFPHPELRRCRSQKQCECKPDRMYRVSLRRCASRGRPPLVTGPRRPWERRKKPVQSQNPGCSHVPAHSWGSEGSTAQARVPKPWPPPPAQAGAAAAGPGRQGRVEEAAAEGTGHHTCCCRTWVRGSSPWGPSHHTGRWLMHTEGH
uniref:ADAM metallopeptidase domain 8 n=1 Tax=Cyanistes caeruleus TaxID=156563 RepID=A0A8C0VI12_CYACU